MKNLTKYISLIIILTNMYAFAQPGMSFSSYYAKNGDNIYYKKLFYSGSSVRSADSILIENADLDSFTVFWEQIYKNEKLSYNTKNDFNYYREDNFCSYIPDTITQVKSLRHTDSLKIYNLEITNNAKRYNLRSGKKSFYAKDKNYVYYKGEIIKDANPNTFNLLFVNNYFTNFNYFIYSDSISVYQDGNIISNIDIKTLKQVGKYYKDSTNVYGTNFEIINYIDAKTFDTVPGGYYYKDKNTAYTYKLKPIINSDPESFKNLFKLGIYAENDVSIDTNHVYFDGKKIDGADPKTIERVKNTIGFIKDKNNVYYCQHTIEGANPKQVKAIRDRLEEGKFLINYISNGQEVIYQSAIIPNSDSKTFYCVDKFDNIYADKYNIYEYNKPLKNVNASKFVLILWHTILSNNSLYNTLLNRFKHDIKTFDDITSFTEREDVEIYFPYSYTIKANNLYFIRSNPPIKKNVNVHELSSIGPYLKAGNQIFFKGIEVLGADAKTFEWIEYNKAKDKKQYYDNGQIIKKQ